MVDHTERTIKGSQKMAETRAQTMIGGDGNDSYMHNSTFQRKMYASVKGIIQEIIQTKLDISKIDKIQIVDLGCSVGPNTFYTVDVVVDAMSKLLQQKQLDQDRDVEFQVFYNDIMDNDFNTLLSTMPVGPRYFAAAVPGSFYQRLFPRDSIHYFNSSMALHWLSRAPPGVANKGRVYIYGGGSMVLDAYMAQFRADVSTFLSSRAEELADGGLLNLLFVCRRESLDLAATELAWPIGYLEPILIELLHEGKVQEDDLNSFQFPLYTPTMQEFKDLVEMDGRYVIHVAQMQDEELVSMLAGSNPDFEQWARTVSGASRAVFGHLIRTQFGEEVLDEAYQRFTTRVHKMLIARDSLPTAPSMLFILQRKNR